MARAERFLVVTLFSAFVLQNLVLYFTTHLWKKPVLLALAFSRKLSLDKRLDTDFVSRNTCKMLAVSVGLVWNFTWYKWFVYTH